MTATTLTVEQLQKLAAYDRERVSESCWFVACPELEEDECIDEFDLIARMAKEMLEVRAERDALIARVLSLASDKLRLAAECRAWRESDDKYPGQEGFLEAHSVRDDARAATDAAGGLA